MHFLWDIAKIVFFLWALGVLPSAYLIVADGKRGAEARAEFKSLDRFGWMLCVFFALIWPIYFGGRWLFHKEAGY